MKENPLLRKDLLEPRKQNLQVPDVNIKKCVY